MCKAFASKTDADSDNEGEQKSDDLVERKTRVRFHVGAEKETSNAESENSENAEQSPSDVVPVINIIPPDDEEHQPEEHDTKIGDSAEQASAKPSTNASTDVAADGSTSPTGGRSSTKTDIRKRITTSSPNLMRSSPLPANGKKKGMPGKNGQKPPAVSSSDGAKKMATAGSNKAQLKRTNSDRNLQKQQSVQASATQSSSPSSTAKK